MCGLAGVLDLSGRPVSGKVIDRMTDRLAHRGPDGRGTWLDGAIGLGHRRLAIIDLSERAAQPMATADGRWVLVYNGEIYNFRELRQELEERGYRFTSAGDTEVVLHALALWGHDALTRFNGMFALALWDRHEQRLLLARDRYGIKPLYWVQVGPHLLFASESKALLAHPALSANIDLEALAEYLTFQNFFTDRTLLAGVRLLPPGTWMSVDAAGGGNTRSGRYWDFHFEEVATTAEKEELAEEVDALFTRAVERQLVSDVAVGTYLSGGIDTGAIAAIAARRRPGMKSFTIGFDLRSCSGLEINFDEREAAEHMSYLFGTEQYEMVLKAGDMERCMASLVWHLEEPRVGQCYPNWYAAKLAGSLSKVVLSGTGGDELFGGYPWRYYRAAQTETDFDSFTDQYFGYWQRLLPDNLLSRVMAPVWHKAGRTDPREIFRSVFQCPAQRLTRPEDYINHSLYFEAKTFLPGLLMVEDKLSMAHGLEARVPLLDNDVVDFAMRLPVRYKLGQLASAPRLDENVPSKKLTYYARTRDGKLLLRDVFRRYVPDEIADRTKQGFSGPDASWFRGESIDFVRRTLFNPKAEIYQLLDRAEVQRLVAQHLDGGENRRLLVWSLLNLEQWCHTFLRGGGEDGRPCSLA